MHFGYFYYMNYLIKNKDNKNVLLGCFSMYRYTNSDKAELALTY